MLAFPQPRSSYISKVIIEKKAYLYFQLIVRFSFVPASLVGEAEGEIWPNPICTTWSLVRNETGQARAHAQNFKSIYLKVSWSMKKKKHRLSQDTNIANRFPTKGSDVFQLASFNCSANQRTSCRSCNWSMTISPPLDQTYLLIGQWGKPTLRR